MRKLRLDLGALVVQTFETARDPRGEGTVRAHETGETTGGPFLCPAFCPSDLVTCNDQLTCGFGCR